MKQNKKIAITGEIGSGKSLVRKILEEQGEMCFDCDEINRELLKDNEYISGISQIFPDAVINDKLNKNILKNIIYNSEKERTKLNLYAHPRIKIKLMEKLKDVNDSRVFVEVPLLNQTDFVNIFDEIWVIYSDEMLKLKRLLDRDRVSKDVIIAQMKTQNSNYNFNIKTIFIENNCSIEELKHKIYNLLK